MKKTTLFLAVILSIVFFNACSFFKKPVTITIEPDSISYVKVSYSPGTYGNFIINQNEDINEVLEEELNDAVFEYWTTEEKRNSDFPYDDPENVIYGSFQIFDKNDELISIIYKDGFMQETSKYDYCLKIDGEIFGMKASENLRNAFEEMIKYSISQAEEGSSGDFGVEVASLDEYGY